MTKFIVRKFNTDETSSRGRESRRRLPMISLNIFLLVVIAVVAISYLYYINQTATGGFDIKGMENRIEQLTKTNKQLEVQAAALQSLSAIEAAGTQAGMVATVHMNYVSATDSSVAVR